MNERGPVNKGLSQVASEALFSERWRLQRDEVARLVAGHDAVISAFNPGWNNLDFYNQQVRGTRAIINGVKRTGIKRVHFVGDADSLEVKPGVQSVDLPEFHAEYKQGALATRHGAQGRGDG